MSDPVTVRYEREAPEVYSNPTNQIQITFENTKREIVNFYIFNEDNKEVQALYSRSKMGGSEETITVYTSQLANGTYNCKLEVGSNITLRKLIVKR